MGRGAGIPIDIRIKLAKHFQDNGYNKKSRAAAQKLYEELSKSERLLHR